VKVVKNKVAPPFRDSTFVLIHGEGISHEAELLDMGQKFNLVEKSGSWFAYDGERLGQGYEASLQFLKEHNSLANKLETAIRKQIDADRAKSEAPRPVATATRTEAKKMGRPQARA